MNKKVLALLALFAVIVSSVSYKPQSAKGAATPTTQTIFKNSTTLGKLGTGSTGLTFNGEPIQGIPGPPGPTYTLPAATNSTLGGIKVGSGLSVTVDGTLNNTGIAGVSTFNNRGGAVKPAFNDYSASMIKGISIVGKTGSYNDLSDKPSIPAAQVNSDWNSTSGVSQILNKPSIPAAQVSSDWNSSVSPTQILNKPAIPTALSQLSQDSTHRTVTDSEKATWNSNSSPVQSVFGRTGTITAQTGDYTADQVGADALGSATSVISNHESSYNHANIPTTAEKGALVGTGGTPGVANPFVTKATFDNRSSTQAVTDAAQDAAIATKEPADSTIIKESELSSATNGTRANVAANEVAVKTVADKQANLKRVSVLDYGAVAGDGGDDKASFEAAFAASDIVEAPAGQFDFASYFSIPSGKTLNCVPGKTILKSTSANASSTYVLMRLSGVDNVHVKGCVFDGGLDYLVAQYPGTSYSAVGSVYAQTSKYGVYVTNSNNVIFDSVKVQNTLGIGMFFWDNIHDSGVRNSEFKNNGIYSRTTLNSFDRAQALAFSDSLTDYTPNYKNFAEFNTFSDSGLDGISLGRQSDFKMVGNTLGVTDCSSLYVSDSHDVLVLGNKTSNYTTACSAYTNCGDNGIEIDNGAYNITVIGNTFSNSGSAGILVKDVHGVTITGNTMNSNHNNPESVFTGSITFNPSLAGASVYDVTIGNNIFTDTRTTPAQPYHFAIKSGSVGTLSNVNILPSNIMTGAVNGNFGAGTSLYYAPIADNSVALGTKTTGDYVAGVTANGGLTKTGTEAATLGLAPCAISGQIYKWNGSAWACAADDGGTGSGTVTSGTAGQLAYYGTSGTTVSGTTALPNGTTATTQTAGDTSTKVATTQFVATAVAGAGGGVTDHGALTGLADDDHTQYALLAGRSGGQTLVGGSGAGENLTLSSTSNTTKGKILLGTTSAFDQTTGMLGLGTTTPGWLLHLYESKTLLSGTSYSLGLVADINPAANSSAAFTGVQVTYSTPSANSANLTGTYGLRGLDFRVTHNGTGAVTGAVGALGITANSGTGSITNAIGGYFQVTNNNPSGVITNAYGVYIPTFNAAGTITNKWGVYQLDPLVNNHFNGAVSIGTTAIGEKLDVSGNVRASGYIISGYEEKTASYTVSKDSSKITLASGTATVTLPASIPAGDVSVVVTVAGAAASGVSFAATGGSISWGDAGVPTFTNSKTADVVCHSQNIAATTTAAWRCVKGGNF